MIPLITVEIRMVVFNTPEDHEQGNVMAKGDAVLVETQNLKKPQDLEVFQ